MASWQVHFFAIPLLLIALGISIYYATAHQLLLISLGISVGHAAARFSDHDVSQKRGATADSDDTNSPVDTATQQTSKAPESKKDLPEIEHTATGNRTSAAASDSAQHLIATSPPNKSQCFRISAIPGSWSKKDLWNGLCSFDSELSVLKSQVSLDTYEACCGTGQTALLKFNPGASCTNIFEKLRRTSNNYELVQEITPKKDDACQQDADPKSVELVIDHHFLHLTPLYTPPSEEVLADIVAVTGLAGHAYGSWRDRKTGNMWLHDFLHKDIKNVRIMTYGYDSRLDTIEDKKHTITEFVRKFIPTLHAARNSAKNRPIIFIAHSMGGLLVLKSLVECSRKSAKVHGHTDILKSTRSLIFFGSPQRGLRTEELKEMVNSSASHAAKDLLSDLTPGSDFLEQLKNDVGETLDSFPGHIVTLYETRTTASVQEVGTTGKFARCGPKVKMVENYHAELGHERELRIPVDKDHSELTKFSSSADTTYEILRRLLEDYSSNSASAVDQTLELVRAGKIDAIQTLNYLSPVQRPQIALLEAHRDVLYQWVTQSPCFQDWDVFTGPRYLCVHYEEKSVLENTARLILDSLETTRKSVVYFSCKSAASRAKCPIALAHTLLYSIASNIDDQGGLLKRKEFLYAFLEGISGGKQFLPSVNSSGPEETLRQLLAISHKCLKAIGDALLKWTDGGRRKLVLVVDSVEEKYKDFVEGIVKYIGINPDAWILFVGRTNQLLCTPDIVTTVAHIDYEQELHGCRASLKIANHRLHDVSLENISSFEWLWDCAEFKKWSDSLVPSLLIVKGKPGSGKSTLCKFVLEKMPARIKLERRKIHSLKNSRHIFAPFFYSSNMGETNHIDMLRTLLYHILKQSPDVLYHFKYGSKLRSNKICAWNYELLVEVLLSIRNHPSVIYIYAIIDAFDESDTDGRQNLVKTLNNLCNINKKGPEPLPRPSCVIKVLLASCPLNDLPNIDPLTAVHTFNIHQQNHSDIIQYTEAIAVKLELTTDGIQTFKDVICQNSDGVFAWVRLVEERILELQKNGRSEDDILSELRHVPKTLEKMYKRIINNIANDDAEFDQVDRRHSLLIFRFVLTAKRPLTIGELQHVIADDDEYERTKEPDPEIPVFRRNSFTRMTPISKIENRVIHCGGNLIAIGRESLSAYGDDVIDVPSSRSMETRSVQVTHQTVQDFLLRVPHEKFVLDKRTCHRIVAAASLRCLLKFLDDWSPDWPVNLEVQWTLEHVVGLSTIIKKRGWMNYILNYLSFHLSCCDVPNDPELQELIKVLDSKLAENIVAKYLLVDVAGLVYESGMEAKDSRTTILLAPETFKKFQAVEILGHSIGDDAAPDGENRLISKIRRITNDSSLSPRDINAKKLSWRTGLHHAIMAGNVDAVRRILGYNVPINTRDKDGWTPLHLAAEQGQLEIVKVLLESGHTTLEGETYLPEGYRAEADPKDIKNRTPLSLAACNGHQMVTRLLAKRSDVEADFRDSEGRTPLSWAAYKGQNEVLKALLERDDVDADSRDNFGRTPLSWAAGRGNEDVVQFLMERSDVDVDSTDVTGRTPLAWATYHRQQAVVLLLKGKVNDCRLLDNLHLDFPSSENGIEHVGNTGKPNHINIDEFGLRAPILVPLEAGTDAHENEDGDLSRISKTLKAAQHDTELLSLESQYARAKEQLPQLVKEHIDTELQTTLDKVPDKDTNLPIIRSELERAREEVRLLQSRLNYQNDLYCDNKDDEYFMESATRLFQSVQDCCVRFSSYSADRKWEILHNLIAHVMLVDQEVRTMLMNETNRSMVFTAILMRLIWERIFDQYLFGLENSESQKLFSIEKNLAEVGNPATVQQWRATTLNILSRRPSFRSQVTQKIVPAVEDIMGKLKGLLRPPENDILQIKKSLQPILTHAVDLAIEMRTHRAEYLMIKPPCAVRDTQGKVISNTIGFSSIRMQAVNAPTFTGADLEREGASIAIVLFPLVIRRGNEFGEDYDSETIIKHMQVFVNIPQRPPTPVLRNKKYRKSKR